MGPEQKKNLKDIYRDSPLRFLGYANEVGEAFRPLVPVEAVYLSASLRVDGRGKPWLTGNRSKFAYRLTECWVFRGLAFFFSWYK